MGWLESVENIWFGIKIGRFDWGIGELGVQSGPGKEGGGEGFLEGFLYYFYWISLFFVEVLIILYSLESKLILKMEVLVAQGGELENWGVSPMNKPENKGPRMELKVELGRIIGTYKTYLINNKNVLKINKT